MIFNTKLSPTPASLELKPYLKFRGQIFTRETCKGCFLEESLPTKYSTSFIHVPILGSDYIELVYTMQFPLPSFLVSDSTTTAALLNFVCCQPRFGVKRAYRVGF